MEFVGCSSHGGRELQPKGCPELSLVQVILMDAKGKAIPNSIYDMGSNETFMNVGRDHDTPVLAIASLRRWWRQLGKNRYYGPSELFITADAGGSN